MKSTRGRETTDLQNQSTTERNPATSTKNLDNANGNQEEASQNKSTNTQSHENTSHSETNLAKANQNHAGRSHNTASTSRNPANSVKAEGGSQNCINVVQSHDILSQRHHSHSYNYDEPSTSRNQASTPKRLGSTSQPHNPNFRSNFHSLNTNSLPVQTIHRHVNSSNLISGNASSHQSFMEEVPEKEFGGNVSRRPSFDLNNSYQSDQIIKPTLSRYTTGPGRSESSLLPLMQDNHYSLPYQIPEPSELDDLLDEPYSPSYVNIREDHYRVRRELPPELSISYVSPLDRPSIEGFPPIANPLPEPTRRARRGPLQSTLPPFTKENSTLPFPSARSGLTDRQLGLVPEHHPGPSRARSLCSGLHHETLLSEIDLLQSQPVWVIQKSRSKPNIPIPQLPPMADLIHSSHTSLIQLTIQAYGQIESLRTDEDNTFGTRTNTPNPSNTALPEPEVYILNRETELEIEDNSMIVRTTLPAPNGQEFNIESFYTLNQTLDHRHTPAVPLRSSSTLLTETEFAHLLQAQTSEVIKNENDTVNESESTVETPFSADSRIVSDTSIMESPDSPMNQFYETIFINRNDRKMLLYVNPRVMFQSPLITADDSYVPYPTSTHPTHSQMSQIHVHCFDPSKTDLELNEIFNNHPPIQHKIVRKIPRAERDSSVAALDSYYGCEDFEKVGHASYFIPMLNSDERLAVGWKPNYRYGKWKYTVQKFLSKLSKTISVERPLTMAHVGREIVVIPGGPISDYKGNSFIHWTKPVRDSAWRPNLKSPMGLLQCILPCFFSNPDPDDEPDLEEEWMRGPLSRKAQKKRDRRRYKGKLGSTKGGDIDALSPSTSKVRHLPRPIMIPVLGDDKTWFFDKAPPQDYTADMFDHTYNKDFGKPYESENNEAGISAGIKCRQLTRPKNKAKPVRPRSSPTVWRGIDLFFLPRC